MSESNTNSAEDRPQAALSLGGGRRWIVLIASLALVAVGLNLWAFSLVYTGMTELQRRESAVEMLDQLHKSINSLKTQKKDAQDEERSAKADARDANQKKTERDRAVVQLNEALEEKEQAARERENSRVKKVQLDEKISDLKKSKGILDREITELGIRKTRFRKEEKESKKRANEERKTALKATEFSQKMKSNYATLKTKFDEDRQKHGGLISKLAKLKGDLEDSRQNQKAAQRRAKDEETQANWAEQRTKDAKKSRDAIELQTAKFTTESERLEKEIRGRNSELQLVQSQAKAAQELSKKLPGLEAEALKFQAEIKGLKGYMQSLNERTKQLKVAKKEADAAADAAVNAREQRETELGEARGVLSSKQREIAAAHFDLMKLKALLPKNEAPPSSNPASSSIKK